MIPKGSTKLDYECEIAIVIGSRARYLSKKDALDVVAGYTICNDVSERNFQAERGGQWTKGKGCETFGPLGPWLVTKDEIKDVQKLDMWLDVNGEKRQRGNTKTMIFGIAHIVWYCSQFFVMEPGDVITTGTPPGVALGMKPDAGVAESRRRRHARHRGARRAETEDREVQDVSWLPHAPRARCVPLPLAGRGTPLSLWLDFRPISLPIFHPAKAPPPGLMRAPGCPLSISALRKNEGSRAPTGAGAEAPHPVTRLAVGPISGSPEITGPVTRAGAPFGALLRLSHASIGPRFPAFAPISQLLAGDRCVPGRSPDTARVRAVRQRARGSRPSPRPGIAGRRLPELRAASPAPTVRPAPPPRRLSSGAPR